MLKQLRQDLQMIVKGLRGEVLPPFFPRQGLKVVRAGAGIATRTLRVARVVRETADAVTLYLDDPSGAPLTWEAGQFFSLQLRVEGVIERRAYSACVPPAQSAVPGAVPITIKRVVGGKVSNYLNDRAREGDRLAVLGPAGSFTLTLEPAAARHVLLVGGGSGITPLRALAESVLAGEPGSRVTLLYGNRRLEDIIFRAHLDELARLHAGRFTLRHVLSEPPAAWAGGVGMLDERTADAELGALGAYAGAEIFVCGPAPMMAAVRAVLAARGVPADKRREEKFSSPGTAAAAAAAAGGGALDATLAAGLAQPHKLDVVLRGAKQSVTVRPGQTLLEAGLAAGLDMPYSCALGGCGACRVKLTSGRTHSDEAGCLSPAEQAGGYVLACISKAASPCGVEVE